jgi:hypothetical protein
LRRNFEQNPRVLSALVSKIAPAELAFHPIAINAKRALMHRAWRSHGIDRDVYARTNRAVVPLVIQVFRD